jgi:RHS repeat-associated protein
MTLQSIGRSSSPQLQPAVRRKPASGPPTPWKTNNVRRARRLAPKSRQTTCNNIFRWYRSGWGRYTQADPLGLDGDENLYRYAMNNPIVAFDPLGLKVELLCRRVYANNLPAWQRTVVNLYKPQHCRLRITCPGQFDKTVGYENINQTLQFTIDDYSPANYGSPWSNYPAKEPCPSNDCQAEKCILKNFAATQNAPGLTPPYNATGPNSNTYVERLAKQCGVTPSFPPRATR